MSGTSSPNFSRVPGYGSVSGSVSGHDGSYASSHSSDYDSVSVPSEFMPLSDRSQASHGSSHTTMSSLALPASDYQVRQELQNRLHRLLTMQIDVIAPSEHQFVAGLVLQHQTPDPTVLPPAGSALQGYMRDRVLQEIQMMFLRMNIINPQQLPGYVSTLDRQTVVGLLQSTEFLAEGFSAPAPVQRFPMAPETGRSLLRRAESPNPPPASTNGG